MGRKVINWIIALALISLIYGATDCTIDATKTYQTIRGFGGINHPDWIDDLSSAQRDKAFKNGDDDLGFTVLRVYVSDDSNAWKKSVDTAKAAQALGAFSMESSSLNDRAIQWSWKIRKKIKI